jgi:hypothetical protein
MTPFAELYLKRLVAKVEATMDAMEEESHQNINCTTIADRVVTRRHGDYPQVRRIAELALDKKIPAPMFGFSEDDLNWRRY